MGTLAAPILILMEPTESAVIVPIPAAERAVAPWRARFDPAAGWGVPAHITVLYPFLPPERLDQAALELLAAAIRTVPRFEVALTRVEWFGDTVVWLAAEPDEGFRALTAAVWHHFPETPPYGGAYADVVPHLTIGDGEPATQLRRAGDAVRKHLPIHTSVEGALVMCGSRVSNSWRSVSELPLGR